MPRTQYTHGYHGVRARTGGWIALLAVGLVVGLAACTGGTEPVAPFAYITNSDANSVSVIDTATNSVRATIPVGVAPVAFGQFIGGRL